MDIKTPTPELVAAYIALFDRQSAITEKAITRLVKAFPRNHDLEDVLLKVVVINRLYSTNIYAVDDVARRIRDLKVDAKFEQRSLEVVDEIARVHVRGKERYNYSFATKYCSWHVPETYPMYDTYVDKLLWAYQKRDNFTPFKRKELYTYCRFLGVLDAFREHYGLERSGHKDLDKFLYQYGSELFPRKIRQPDDAPS